MSGKAVEQAAAAGQSFEEAHRHVLADRNIQLDMLPVKQPDPPPQWLIDFFKWLGKALEPVGEFLNWIGSFLPDAPYARILFWGLIVLLAAAIIWMVVERLRSGEWKLPRLKRRELLAAAEAEVEWTPDAAPVREWLREADALASEGRYAEAVHLLLLRSVEDIGRRRPQLLRPALTSRDLSRATAIPFHARAIFANIAAVVERSLFGRRAVQESEWLECRNAYADFAKGGAWKA